MKQKVLLSLVLYLLLGISAWAQTRAVSGRVTGAGDGAGLPGVTVLERGTTNGTSTDAGGNFTLNVQEGASLIFSSIGFVSQTLPVTGGTINVRLQTNETLLNEAVVVGYGTQAKRDLTGSVTQLSSKDVENVPTVSFEQAIQGRTPGVQINQGSGKLGQGVTIRVRGSSSITASNQPLYVIDGIPVTSQDVGLASSEPLNPLADLNPNDIESITILKDAAASAIYGSRASNGVILVTTKKGRQGESKVNVGYYVGTSRATRIREFLNRDQYKEFFGEAITNASLIPGSAINAEYGPNDGSDPDYLARAFSDFGGIDYNSNLDTKWNELAFRKGKVSQYDANISGGDAKTRFYISGNYSDQTGIIIGNQYRRGSLRTNFDHNVSDKLKVGLNLSLVRSVNDRVPDDNAFTNPIQMNALPPLQAAYDPTDPTGFNRGTLYENALVSLNTGTNRSGNYRSIGTATLSFQPIKNLTLRSELGGDFLSLREELYYSRLSNDGAPDGYGYSNQVQAVNYTTNNTATWAQTIGEDHTFDVLAGFTFQRYDQSQSAVEGRGFPSDQFRRLASAARFTSGSGSSGTGYSFLSLLSRVNYAFANRYLFSASIRGDQSSRFGREERWGVFPAASAGWVISEESFLQENSVVSFLKLRASYGLTGNAEIGNFDSRTLYSGSQYGSEPGIVPGVVLGNDQLTWENTAQADLGLEFGFANDRITGEVDVYQKNTTDLLLNDQLPFTGGYQVITRNLGKLRNRGVEFSLNTRNIDNAFKWTTNFNITFNRNEVSDLNGQILTTGSRNLSNVREGEPIGVFWGIEYAGVDPANGDALYYTADGSKTNQPGDAERRKLGDPNPDFTGGLTNTFAFKGFEVSLLNQFTYGNDVYNTAGFFQSVNGDYFDNQTVDQLKRWQKPGDVTNVPQARFLEGNGGRASSRWIQDGSFFRFKNLTVAYNLPKEWAGKARLSNARIYVTGQNLLTITNYDGYDPEVNSSFNGLPNYLVGHDFYTPPLAKTWLVGVNLGF
ncbi:TonB-dependent receptor [Hymenobacter sp. BT18]|uniref:SusC/RagA family TonB-linked outer membrane protein n=1 Tax=Hymenobacter sp. BT18 TaxID=2835648 RepID=UPI00143EDB33|nr:TonB-dependent receptor [Hymenobacter sp. BT18]QIX60694.1 TonB-dependent receptor [Hymenobacter sp. BT18]